MLVRVLGPVEVERDDSIVSITRPLQRRALALLAIKANKVVDTDWLVEALWRGAHPSNFAASLHSYVSRLRKVLAPAADVERVGDGYRLHLGPGQLDTWRFEELHVRARAALQAGDPSAAEALLTQALSLHRGQAFPEIDDVDLAIVERRRIEELRLSAEEDRVDALLALGREEEAVAVAGALVAVEPLRERLWQQRMLGLYRSGRQAEAIRVADALRRTLRSEVGLDPGPESIRLERALFDQAPWLDRISPTVADHPTQPPPPSSPPISGVSPRVCWTASDGVHLAYEALGDGPPDLVYVPSYVSHLDVIWELPAYARFLNQLASRCRLLLFDKRGMGLSDRVAYSTFDDRARDVIAVLDAAQSRSAVLFGSSEGAAFCAATAVAAPERVRGLVLFGSTCSIADDSYPWAPAIEDYLRFIERVSRAWGTGRSLAVLAPSVADNPEAVAWFGRMERLAVSPTGLFEYQRMQLEASWSHLLQQITVPVLVLHRRHEVIPVEAAEFIAEAIPRATLRMLDGTDHLPWFGDADAVADHVLRFAMDPAAAVPP